MSTPAGWYPDPENPGQLRYWDGARWTEDRTPVPSAQTEEPLGQTTTSEGEAPAKRRLPVWLIVVLTLITAGLFLIGYGIYVMWRDQKFSKNARVALSVAGALVVLVFMGVALASPEQQKEPADIAGALVPEEEASGPEPIATETTSTEQVAEEAEVAEEEPSFDAEAYAAKIEKTFVAQFGRPIKEACDVKDPTWHCYYTGIEASSESRVNMTLTFEGGISEDQAKDMAQRAGLHFFNFIGDDFEKLDMIVVYDGTGLDIGTIYRDDVPLLNQ